MEQSVFLCVEHVLKMIVVMDAQHCEYIKSHGIVHF